MATPIDAIQNLLGFGTKDEDRKAKDYLNQITGAYDGITPPDLKDIELARQIYAGDLDPRLVGDAEQLTYDAIDAETAQAVLQGDSEMKQISTDPRLRDAQMDALLSLQEIADRGGRSAEDDANLARIQNQNAQADRGRREAILQNMAARGMGGSGTELLAQLQSSQAATDRSAQQGLDIAALAQLRQQDALMNAGQMGGSIRNQDFGEKSQIAQAQDAINRFNASTQTQNNQFNANANNNMSQFNAGNTLDTQRFNIGTTVDIDKTNTGITNAAKTRDLDTRQGILNANTGITNQQITHNSGLPQQRFENEAKVAQGKAGAAASGVDFYSQQAKRKTDQFGNVIGGAATLGGAAITKSDERAKKDVKEVSKLDIEQFLNSLEPKKFKYKSKKDGEGEQAGVMAQDLLKTKLGSEAVVQTEDGDLGFDNKKMQGITLAVLKHLSDKIDGKE